MSLYYPTIDMEATGKRIMELRKERHISVSEISEFMGFENPQAVYKWQQGKSLPSVDNIFALSRLFQISIEDILVETAVEGSLAGEAKEPLPLLNELFAA